MSGRLKGGEGGYWERRERRDWEGIGISLRGEGERARS